MAINDKLNLTSPKQAAKEINDYAKQVKKDVEKAGEKNKIKIGSLTVTYDATELNKKRLEAEAELQKNHDIGKEKLNNKFKLFYTPKGSDKKEITKSKKSLMGSTKLEGEYKTKYDEYSQNVKGDPKQKATSKEVMGIMRYAQHAENLMGVAASEVTDATSLADLEKKLDALIDIYKIYHKIKELEKTGRKFGGALEDDKIKQIHSFVQNNFMNEAEKVVGKGNIKGSIDRGTLGIINNSDNPYIQRMGEQARAKIEEIDKEAKALETYYKTKALTAMQEDQASRKELANQNVAYSNAEIEKLEKQLKERQLQMKKSLQDSYDRYKQEGTNKNKESLARDYYKYTNTGAVLDDMPEIQSFFESIKGETNKDKVYSMLGSTSDIDNKMQEWLNATNTNYKAYTEIVNKMDEVKAMRDEATKTLVGIDAEEHGMDSMLVTLSKEVEEYKELAKSLETQLAATKEMSKNLVSQEEVTELKERLEFVNALVKEQEKELSKYEEIKNRVVNGGFGDNGTGTGNGTGKGTGTSSSNGDSKAENLNNDDTPLPKIKDLIKALDDGFSKVSNEFRENMTEIIDSLSKQIKTLFVGENTEDMLTSFKSSFTTMIESLNREFSKIGDKLNINTSPLDGEVSEMQQLLEVLNKISEKVELISAKDFQISADFSNLENVAGLLDTIKSRLGEVKSNIKKVENSADTVEEAKPTATTANLEAAKAQVTEYENKVAEARAEYEEFKASMSGKVNLDENAVKEHLDEIQTQIQELNNQKISISVENLQEQIKLLEQYEDILTNLLDNINDSKIIGKEQEEKFEKIVGDIQEEFRKEKEFSEEIGNYLAIDNDQYLDERIENTIETLQKYRDNLRNTRNESGLIEEQNGIQEELKETQKEAITTKDILENLFKYSFAVKFPSGLGMDQDVIDYKASKGEDVSGLITREQAIENLNSELSVLVQNGSEGLNKLKKHAKELEEALSYVYEAVKRISKKSSIKDIISSDEIANEAATISQRLRTLYDEGKYASEEFVAQQYKIMKLFDKETKRAGGVKGSGAKNSAELRSWIMDSWKQKNPDFDSTPVIDVIWGRYGFSTSIIDEATGKLRKMKDVILDICDYNGNGTSGWYQFEQDEDKLKQLNTIIEYVKDNFSELQRLCQKETIVDTNTSKIIEEKNGIQEADTIDNQIKILEAREQNLKEHQSELSQNEINNLVSEKNQLEQNLKTLEKELETKKELAGLTGVGTTDTSNNTTKKSKVVKATKKPVGIPVEPSVDAAEFAKKVTEEIANTSADIDVKPTLSNPAEFASEVAKQLNGHHVDIEVGTKIGEGSKAAEVAENLAKAEKKAGVETEETTQKVKEQKKEVEKKTITTSPTKTTTSTKTTLPTKPLKNENTDIEKKISEKIAQLEKEKEKRDRLKAEEKKIRDKFEGKNDSDTYKNVKKKIEEEKVDPWLKANELYQKYQREGDAQAYNAAACYYGFHIQDAKKKGEKPNPFMTLDGKNISNQLILRRNKSVEAYTYWEKSTEKQQNEEKQKLQKAANEATAQEDYVKQLEKELKQLQQEVKQLEKEKKSAKITNSSKNTNSNKKAKKSKGMTTEELIAGVYGGSSEKQTATTPSSTKQQEISGVDENYVKKLKEVISLNNKLSNVDKRTKVGKGLKAQIEEVYAEYPKWKEFAKELQKLKVDDKGKFVNPDDIENFKKLAVEIAKADGAYKEFVKDQKEASEGSPATQKKSKSSKKNTKSTEEPDNSTPDNNKDLNPNEGQEKADMLTLEEAVKKVKKAVDDKTKAFKNEETTVSSVVSDEVGSLDKLKQAISEIAVQVSSLKRMIDTLPPIDLKVNEEMDLGVLETTLVNIAARIEEVSSINPHFGNNADLEELSKQLKGVKLDDATTTALSELDTKIREVDTKKVSTLAAQLERIGKNTTLSENIQKIANAFLNLKTNLNNISPSATDFLNTIKEIGNLGKNLENIVEIMNASKEQIAKAKKAAGSKKSDGKSSKVNDGNDAEYKALEKSSEEYKKVIARNKEALKAIGNTYDVFRTTRRDEETGEQYISYNVKGENGSGIIGKNGTLLLDKAQVSDDYSKQKSDVKDLIKLYKEYLELLKKIHSYEYQDRNGKKEDPEKRAKYESNVEKINEINQSIRDFESRIEKGEITLNEKEKKDLHDARTNVQREKSVKENTIQKEQVRNENARQEQEAQKEKEWKTQIAKNAKQEKFYEEQVAKLRAEGEEQQRKFNSDLDEVNNTLMKEYKESYDNDQKKWKNFQKEQQEYTSKSSKEEFKLEQDSEYEKLKDLVSRYTTVATRAADPKKALEGDALEAEELLENIYQQEQKIHDLPIMDESKTRAALKPLGELENKLKDIAATIEKREAGSNKIVSTVSANGLSDSQQNLEKQVRVQNQIYETQRKINLADEEEKPSLKYKLEQLKEQKAKLEEILLTTSEFKNLDDAKKSELLAEYNKKIDVRTKTSKNKMEISQNETYKERIDSNNDELLNISSSKINQGIDVSRIYEESEKSLEKYNKQLLEGKLTLATYEKNVAKLKSQLKEVIAVVDTASEGQAQDAIMKDLQAKTGGNYKITDSKKGQIVAQFSEGKGVVKDLIYQYDQFTGAITRVENAHSKLQGMGKFWSEMGSKFRDVGKYFLSFVSIYDVWRVFRNGVEYVKEMDTAMTELTKVSNDSKDALEAFKNESYEIAEQVGSTGTTVVESAANWERLGESLEQAKESAKASTILFNVSEFESIDAATESLVSMSQAYKELDKMEIVDKMNNIGNNYSIATDELATGLKDAAAVLQTQGNDLDEAIALITAGNAITQDASKTAGGVRTIALRIAGTEEAEETLEAEGEDVSDYVVMTSAKKQKIIKDYTAVASNNYQGVNILDDNGNLKNTYNILLEISKVYKEIQEEDKKYGTNRAQALVEELAGKNRSNIAASILQNPEMLEDVNRDSANSSGSAEEELETQLESIETHIEEVKNKWQQLWQQGVNKAFVNGILDLVKMIEGVANAIGLIPLSIASVIGMVKLKAAATKTIRKQEQALNEEMAEKTASANNKETESLRRETEAAREASKASKEHAEADRIEAEAHVESFKSIDAKVATEEAETVAENQNTISELENQAASEGAAAANVAETESLVTEEAATNADNVALTENTMLEGENAASSNVATTANKTETGSLVTEQMTSVASNATRTLSLNPAIMSENLAGLTTGADGTVHSSKGNWISNAKTSVKDKLMNTLDGVGNAFESGLTKIKGKVSTLAQSIWGFVTSPVGGIMTVAGIFTTVSSLYSNWQKEQKEKIKKAYEDAENKMNSLNESMQTKRQFVEEKGTRYAELAQRVDLNTNQNIDLSEGDYKEFLEISNELAELFPSLKNGIDAEGNAILNLNGSARTINESLKETLDLEERLNRKNMLSAAEDKINNSSEKINELDEAISEAQKPVDAANDKAISSQMETLFKGGKAEVIESNYGALYEDSYDKLKEQLINAGLSEKDIEKASKSTKTNGIESYTIDFSVFHEGELKTFKEQWQKYKEDVEGVLNEANKDKQQISKDLSESLMAYWLPDQSTFKKLPEEMQSAMQQYLENVNWFDVEGFNEADNKASFVEAYIKNNILKDLSDLSKDDDAFSKYKEVLTQNKDEDIADYIERVNNTQDYLKNEKKYENIDLSYLTENKEKIVEEYNEQVKGFIGNNKAALSVNKLQNLSLFGGENQKDLLDLNAEYYSLKKQVDSYDSKKPLESDEQVLYDKLKTEMDNKKIELQQAKEAMQKTQTTLENASYTEDDFDNLAKKLKISNETDYQNFIKAIQSSDGVFDNIEKRYKELQLDARASASDTAKSIQDEITKMQTNLSTVDEVLSAGGTLTLDQYNTLIAANSKYADCLVATADGIKLDAKASKELEEQMWNEKQAEIEVAKAQDKLDYHNLTEKLREQVQAYRDLEDASNSEREACMNKIGETAQELSSIEARIVQYELLSQQIADATSKFTKFTEAQSAVDSGANYDTMVTATSSINDAFDTTHKFGTAEFEAAVDLMIPDKVSDEGIEAIEKYKNDVLKRYMKYDGDGNIKVDGLQNFITDSLSEENGLLTGTKDNWVVAENTKLEDFAEKLKLTKDAVVAIFGELEEYGYGTQFDFTDELIDSATDSYHALEEIEASLLAKEAELRDKDLWYKKDKDGNYKTDKDGNKILTKEAKVVTRRENKTTKLEKKAAIKTGKELGSNLDDIVELEKRQKAYEKAQAKAKKAAKGSTEEFAKAAEEERKAGEAYEEFAKKVELPTQIDIEIGKEGINEDLENISKKIEKLEKKKEKLAKEQNVDVSKVDESKIIDEKTGQSLEQWRKVKETEEQWLKEMTNLDLGTDDDLTQLEKLQTQIDDMITDIEGAKEFEIDTTKAETKITTLSNRIATLKTQISQLGNNGNKKSFVSKISDWVSNLIQAYTGGTYNGHTIVKRGNGEAFANGGTVNNGGGNVLVGELGTELISDRKTGTWYTVGENGAEFVNLNKGDIVFNHKQTEKLLAGKKTKARGEAFANGNASDGDYEIAKKYLKLKNKKERRKSKYMGNVDLNHRPVILDGEQYHTLLTETFLYSDFEKEGLKIPKVHKGDKAFNFTPITQSGKWYKNTDEVYDKIWNWIEAGNRLEDFSLYMGSYKSLKAAEKAAEKAHNNQAKMYDKEAKALRKVKEAAKDKGVSVHKYLSKYGEAKANGGVVRTGRALVGELGQEIVVDRKTGTWRTVGDNGAEFVNLNKGDIVFNHEQTEKLLNSSSTDNRGNEAYVNGTHQSGQAYVTSTPMRSITDGSEEKKKKKGKTDNKDEKDDKDDKTKTPLEKFQEWLSKFFDWIEVRLSRLETKIDSAITKAEKYVSDGNYSKAGTQYKKAINTTSSLINVNRKGATKYTSQANRVLNKAVSDGLIKDKQASGIKKKVANGSIDISEYGEKMREVISAYQEYYEKALSCSTATTELKNSMKDYYEALYNLPIDKASRKIEEFSAKLEVLTSKASAISGGTKNYEEVVKADAKARYNTANNKVEKATKEKETADKKVTSTKNALLSATKNKSVIKAAKANKTVDTKGLKGKALKAAKAYNKALSEQKTSNSQLKTAKEIRDNQKSQMNDLPNYDGEYYKGVNSVLKEETKNQKAQLKEYNNAKKTTDSNFVKADNNLEKKKATLLKDKGLTKAQKKAIKDNKEIDTSKLKGKALKHANAYNEALQKQTAASNAAATATQNLEKAESEFVSTKQDNAKTMLDNVSSYYDSKNALTESKISYEESNISLKKAKGETVTRNDYKGIEENAKLIHEQASQELAAYQTQYDAVKGDLSEADNEAALQKIEELKKAEVDAYTAMKTYHQEAIQADIDNVEKELGLVGTQSETLTDERGIRDNINKQMELTNKKYQLLIEQEADATKQAQLRAEQQQAIVSLLQQQIEKEEKLSSIRIDRHSADANREQTNTDVKTASGKDSVEILADNYRTQADYSGRQEQEYRSLADKLFSEDEGGLYSSEWGSYSEDRSTFYISEDKWNAWNEEINKAIEYYSKANQAQVDRLNNEFTAWETENITPLEDKLSENERTISKEQSTIDLNNVKGIKTTVADYQKLIGLSEEKVASLNEEKAAYMEQLKNYDVGSTKYKELKQKIDEIDTSTASVEKETEEWKNAMVQLTFDNLDEANEKLNTMISYCESVISLMEAMGEKPIDLDYIEVMEKNNEEIENKRKAAQEAFENSNKAKASDNGVFGGKTQQEWMDMYYSYNTDVNNLLIKNEELKDSIINTYVRPFEEAYERYKTCYNIYGQMQSLFSSYSFDEEGNLTEYGFAELDSMVNQYDAAVKAGGAAQKELNKIDELFASGADGLSEDEWKEKRQSYIDQILSSASDAQSALQGIAQIQTTIMQNELDNLKELIDTRKEALQKKKEYYDYDKTIRNKTKDIQSIESQIAALNATEDGLEKRKKLLELQEQLKDAKDDLEDTTMEHQISLVTEGLDDFMEKYSEEVTKKIDALNSNLTKQLETYQETKKITTEMKDIIAGAYDTMSKSVRVDIGKIKQQADGSKKIVKGFSEGGTIGGKSWSGDKLIARVNSGETILTKDFTDLMPSAVDAMENFVKIDIPDFANILASRNPAVTISYENMINISGNANTDTVKQIESLIPKITQSVTKNIVKDLRKNGF